MATDTSIDFSTGVGYTISNTDVYEIADGKFRQKVTSETPSERKFEALEILLGGFDYELATSEEGRKCGLLYTTDREIKLSDVAMMIGFTTASSAAAQSYDFVIQEVDAIDYSVLNTLYRDSWYDTGFSMSSLDVVSWRKGSFSEVTLANSTVYFIGFERMSDPSPNARIKMKITQDQAIRGQTHAEFIAFDDDGVTPVDGPQGAPAYRLYTNTDLHRDVFSLIPTSASPQPASGFYSEANPYWATRFTLSAKTNITRIVLYFAGLLEANTTQQIDALGIGIVDEENQTVVAFAALDSSGLENINSGRLTIAGNVIRFDEDLDPGSYKVVIVNDPGTYGSGLGAYWSFSRANIGSNVFTGASLSDLATNNNNPILTPIEVFGVSEVYFTGLTTLITPTVDGAAFGTLKKIRLSGYFSSLSSTRVFVSFDDGTTWKTYNSVSKFWYSVAEADLVDKRNLGLTPNELANLTAINYSATDGWKAILADTDIKLFLVVETALETERFDLNFVEITYDDSDPASKIPISFRKEGDKSSGTLIEEPSWPIEEELKVEISAMVTESGRRKARALGEVRSKWSMRFQNVTPEQRRTIVQQFSTIEKVVYWPTLYSGAMYVRRIDRIREVATGNNTWTIEFNVEEVKNRES